jgi:hypothetical protein
VTAGKKLAVTAVLFAVAIGLVALTAGTHTYVPLFLAWVPLVGAAWILAQREPGYVSPPPARRGQAPSTARDGGETNGWVQRPRDDDDEAGAAVT